MKYYICLFLGLYFIKVSRCLHLKNHITIGEAMNYRFKLESLKSLEKYIPPDYDQSLPPFLETKPDTPLLVQISLKLRDVHSVDEQKMEITVEWFLRLYWTDDRLIPPTNLTEEEWQTVNSLILDYIWVPEPYIDHVREITWPKVFREPHFVRMDSKGKIWYSRSLISRLSCPMDFSAYPFDSQTCIMLIEDYPFDKDYIVYEWLLVDKQVYPTNPQFTFEFEAVSSTAHHVGYNYAGVSIKIILRRSVASHIMNTYFPSTLLVMVSWLSFLIPTNQVPGRMILCITTLLTLMSMFSVTRKEGPQVSYAKAIDQWMLICLLFVFLVLIEFAVVLYLLNRQSHKTLKVTPSSATISNKTVDNTYNKSVELAQKIEKWSWIFLSISFITFMCIYWIYWNIP